jgi:hypothetical protein
MAKLGHDPLWIARSHPRELLRIPARVERAPKGAVPPLALALRVFLLAALGIAVFIAVAVLLTGA